MEENLFWIWFAKLNISPIKKYNLIRYFKEVGNIFLAKEEELLKVDKIDLIDASYIAKDKDINLIKKCMEIINKMKIKIININDRAYPDALRKIYDPPVVLFLKGNVDLLNRKMIAIVGSREADKYGLIQSYNMAYGLAKSGFVIVSGLAKGIDKMAHLGALKADKDKTIAVLGSGLDIIYPKENYDVYKEISNNGLLISEFIIGTRPMSLNFPMRNRIVSALSNGVLVVEAKRKSGAMITVDYALEEGKNVYAIPGNIDNPLSEGCNFLISQGSKVVTELRDILEDFN